MAFLIQCSNKGCYQSTEALLDSNNKVICAKCSKEIVNVTEFMKKQMKSAGQVLKNIKKEFAFKCASCNVIDQPIIKGDLFYCSSCNKEMKNISEPFKIILKEKLGKK